MSRTTESPEPDAGPAARTATGSGGSSGWTDWTLQGLVVRLGFWSAIVLPAVAIALLVVQPAHWWALLAAVVVLAAVSLVVGHCHGLEC